MAKKKVYLAQQSALDSHVNSNAVHVSSSEKTKIANALTGDNVIPAADASLTKLIATIGGKQIKAPEGGGGGGGDGYTVIFQTRQERRYSEVVSVNDGELLIKADRSYSINHYESRFDGPGNCIFVDSLNNYARPPITVTNVKKISWSGFYEGGNYGLYKVTPSGATMIGDPSRPESGEYTVTENMVIFICSGTCLDGSTLVTMADRTEKRIDSIEPGDKVLAYDAADNSLVADEIVFSDIHEVKTFDTRDTWVFEGGFSVKTIRDHELYNVEKGGMKYMKDWKVGEHAVTLDGREVALLDHIVEKGEFRHFMITGHHHNFFVNGLLNGDRHSEVCLARRAI